MRPLEAIFSALGEALTELHGHQVTRVTGLVAEGATTLPVESTIGFPSVVSYTIGGTDYLGRIVLDGRVYYYTGITATSFTGLEYDNRTGTFSAGTAQDHQPLTQVDDYSKATSGVDLYRRGFLSNFAEGDDLTVLGKNLGIERPEALADDTLFRRLIQAIAYAPRGTMYALEGMLDALLGTGGWEVFENLTLGSPARGVGNLQDNNTVFVGRPAAATSESPYGKAYLDGYEDVRESGGTITISPDEALNVASVQAAPDTSKVLVAQGGGLASTDGLSCTLTGSTLPAYVFPGDILAVTSGPLQGSRAVIQSITSTTLFAVGPLFGYANPSGQPSGGFAGSFSGADWEVRRDVSQWGYYLPQDESILEGGVVRATTWEQIGTGTSVVQNLNATTGPSSSVYGPNLESAAGASSSRLFRRVLRVRPEDEFEFDVYFDPFSTNGTGPNGAAVALIDGDRVIAVGASPTGAGTSIEFGFADLTTNSYIGATSNWSRNPVPTIYIPGLNALRVVKKGTDTVALYRSNRNAYPTTPTAPDFWNDFELIAEVPYTSFPTLTSYQTFVGALYSVLDPELVFGSWQSSDAANWRYLSWNHRPEADYWNKRFGPLSNMSSGGATLTALGVLQFLPGAGDVGNLITVKDFGVQNANGGNSLGAWEITGVTGTSLADVTGPTQSGGSFSLTNTSAFFIRDEFPFVWPNHLGHSLEILSGANVGVYPIVGILDGSGTAYTGGALGTTGMDSAAAIRTTEESNAVLVSGVPSGGFTVGEQDVSWRLVPNFAVDTNIVADLPAGTEAGGVLTLPVVTGLPADSLYRVSYSRVESAYLHDPTEMNTLTTLTPRVYRLYPFYLADSFGYIRRQGDLLTAAGVEPDFDSFYRDATGPHIRR